MWCKTNLSKVMVLCAVAQPRQVGGSYFDGLIGSTHLPKITYTSETQSTMQRRSSTCDQNVDAEVYREVV